MISAIPTTTNESPVSPCDADRRGDAAERDLPRRAVHERRAEEQRGGAERADDEVLEPRLERALEVVVDRAHDVERDREPLEREEERHEVRGADEERHAARRREEEREELRHVVVAAASRVGARVLPAADDVLRREERRGEPDGEDDDLAERRSSGRGSRRRRRSCGRRRCRRRARSARTMPAMKPAAATPMPADAPRGARHEHGAEERDERRADQREDRASANQSMCGVLSSLEPALDGRGRARAEEGVVADRRRPGREEEQPGTRAARRARARPAAGRAPRRQTVEPRASCRTAEISRSMYIAASTIAPAPIAAHHQARWKTPARMRNSPANDRRAGHGERDHADASSAASRAPVGRAPSRRAAGTRRSSSAARRRRR